MSGYDKLDKLFDQLTAELNLSALCNAQPMYVDFQMMSLHDQADPKAEELGKKAAADILLHDSSRRIIVPSSDEWHGLNLIDRDN